MRTATGWIVLGLTAASASVAPAQVEAGRRPAPGDRIEVESRCAGLDPVPDWCGHRLTPIVGRGTLRGLTRDSLFLDREEGDSLVALPLSAIERAWVLGEPRTHFWKGALMGALVGAIAGAAAGGAAGQDDPAFASLHIAVGGGGGLLGGFLLGGLVGASIRSDRRTPVALGDD